MSLSFGKMKLETGLVSGITEECLSRQIPLNRPPLDPDFTIEETEVL